MRINREFPCLFNLLRSRCNYIFTFLFFCFPAVVFPQSDFLDSLLNSCLARYDRVLRNPSSFRLQVFYTQINRDSLNTPQFTDHQLRVANEYVYPASTVKLPMSILALIKLEELNLPLLEKSSAMITDSAFSCRKRILADSTSGKGYPSLENYLKKMLLVSDNQAFARTYDFVSYDYAHNKLFDLGFDKIKMPNRLEGQCYGDTVSGTAPVYFLSSGGDTIYKQKGSVLSLHLEHPFKPSTAGTFHRNGKGRWVNGPKDFSTHNYLPLADLHRLMKKLVFNNYMSAPEKMPLSEENRTFLLKQLGRYPRESDFPDYNPKQFYDSYKKYLMYGSAVARITQDTLRIMNIVGRAYGFLIDCAYVVDLKNNIEFLVTCAIYVNKNGKIGSGKYEYDEVGLPFMKDLGWCIYNYERNRKRDFNPDLSEFYQLFNRE